MLREYLKKTLTKEFYMLPRCLKSHYSQLQMKLEHCKVYSEVNIYKEIGQ